MDKKVKAEIDKMVVVYNVFRKVLAELGNQMIIMFKEIAESAERVQNTPILTDSKGPFMKGTLDVTDVLKEEIQLDPDKVTIMGPIQSSDGSEKVAPESVEEDTKVIDSSSEEGKIYLCVSCKVRHFIQGNPETVACEVCGTGCVEEKPNALKQVQTNPLKEISSDDTGTSKAT